MKLWKRIWTWIVYGPPEPLHPCAFGHDWGIIRYGRLRPGRACYKCGKRYWS